MIVTAFLPHHLDLIEVQNAQKPFIKWMTPEIADAAAEHFSLTGATDDGRIVGCAGIAPLNETASIAWAVFSPLLTSFTIPSVRLIHRVLKGRPEKRIEAHIMDGHEKAARFAERLHFKFECTRKDLHPSGSPLHVYVRERF